MDEQAQAADGVQAETVSEVKPKARRTRASSPVKPVEIGVTAEALAPVLEAVLLSVDRPAPAERLAEGLKLVSRKGEGDDAVCDPAEVAAAVVVIESAVKLLNEDYAKGGRAFRIESVAGGYRLMTLPAFAERIAEYHRTRLAGKLSRASVETLAIVAYKQPLTKAALEAIRGVSCGEVLKTLMDRRLVTIKGRAEELGRPMLYGTTKTFLDQFGLESIKDLPTVAELKANG